MAKDDVKHKPQPETGDLAGLEARLLEKERQLAEREKRLREKERQAKKEEKTRKQVLLRLAPALYNEVAKWAEQDFRSVNSQIEYLLTEAVNRRKKTDTRNS